ncbi:MAG: nucleoside triphosphate pyrophosphohydrolase, partial [Deltaproteobacteria bacterium]|nr:nucleoside triphosphate pyrophosphohydrolase [Deltaproteobacteria bacterium]MBW2531117.1 nucleoside triphosphate pyrophosphohydrolase [Deltaproteobacteria bacterium]
TLRRHLLEEAAEVAQAIDGGDRGEICEELGDLLMHVAFLAELGRRERAFGPDDVVAAIVDKLIRRHPHVFGTVAVDDSQQVLRNWEAIKADERQRKGGPQGILAGVPRGMPALARAQRVTEKVARVGFDWPSAAGPRDKLTEELGELDRALERDGERERSERAACVEEELGDLLLTVVNLARHVGVDAEAALSKSVGKFVRRFAGVERRVARERGGFTDGVPLSIDELDRYWDEAKEQLRAAAAGGPDPSDPHEER